MPGPLPKPREVKEGMGNPGKRAMKTAPARVAGLPDMPSTFKGDAKACWVEVVDLLAKRGQLTLDSRRSLVALCEVFAHREKLRKDLERKGYFHTVKTTAGDRVEKARPAVAAFQDADRRYLNWLTHFGLTDATRGKVHVDPRNAPGDKSGRDAGKPADEARPRDPAARYGLQ